MKTILTTAYAINPYKGSEDGMGWNHILQIAKTSKVIAITRKNNLEMIHKYVEEHQLKDLNVSFHGYDLPYWMRFWKRGQSGSTPYFYLWQFFMPLFILWKGFRFDVAHNLNFHTDWIPTFLWVFRKPVVWGPVGHHPKIPSGYYHYKNSTLTVRLKNQVIWAIKKLFWTFDPFFYLAKWNADVILCFSPEVSKQMNVKESKVEYMYSVGSEEVPFEEKKKDKFRILSVGRLVPLKGFDITVRSFHAFLNKLATEDKNKVELVIVGKGEMYQKLTDYVKSNELDNHIKVIDWMDREELKEYYKSSSLFFFPSHEGAGMVVPEAFSFGVPTLCFDNCGPGTFVNPSCGVKIPYSNYNNSIAGFATELETLFNNPELTKQLGKGARKEFTEKFVWSIKSKRFKSIYNRITSEKLSKNLFISSIITNPQDN